MRKTLKNRPHVEATVASRREATEPARIEVGIQGFVNPNSRDGHRPMIKGKAWSGLRTRKGGSAAVGDEGAGSAWQDGDDEVVARGRRRRTKYGETPRVDVTFLLRPKGWEGIRTKGGRR